MRKNPIPRRFVPGRLLPESARPFVVPAVLAGILLTILAAASAVSPSAAWARPASPFAAELTQPDGTAIALIQRGDERFHWSETTDGYALARNDRTGWWEYALRSGDALLPSGRIYRPGGAAPSGAIRSFVPPASLQGRSRLFSGGRTQGSARWTPRPVSGDRSILLIRVAFQNRALSLSADLWGNLAFGEENSVARYYRDQSGGRLRIGSALGGTSVLTVVLESGDVNGGDHPDGFIDVKDENTAHLHEVAFLDSVLSRAAAAGFDFAARDADGDGRITPEELAVYLIVAGYEESDGPKTPSVWAHAWQSYSSEGTAHTVVVAGKILTDWAMNGELFDDGKAETVGTIAHEMGHQIGKLPDLYDVNGKNGGLGNFSLMAAGCLGFLSEGETPGSRPVALDAWSRRYVGWETPKKISRGFQTLVLGVPRNGSHPAVQLLGSGHRDSEYYLVEVRAPRGWDEGLLGFSRDFPGFRGGLLVQHVDELVGAGSLSEGNDLNAYVEGAHQGCMAVEADGPHLSRTDEGKLRGSQYTLWYEGNPNYVGEGVLTDGSDPNSLFWDGSVSGISLWDISEAGTTMTCRAGVSGGGRSGGGFDAGMSSLPSFVLLFLPVTFLYFLRRKG